MIAVVGVGAAIFAVWLYLRFLQTILASLILGGAYLLLIHWKWCYISLVTIPRDLRAHWCYVKLLWTAKKFSDKNLTLPDIFHETVQRHPDKPCFLFQDEVWTFKEVENYSLRVTAVLKKHGVKKGSIVGLFTSNCPQMPALWLGIARLGGITPLINNNQRGNTLIHSINVAKCDVLIFSEEYQSAIQDVSSELDPALKLFKLSHRRLNTTKGHVNGSGDGVADFTSLLEATPPAPWTLADADGFSGKLLYIYTSGTTGLPKAAVISNSRFVFFTCGMHVLGLRPSDIVYCPLPLYHTGGGVVSIGQALIYGCTVVLKTKFSASQYFPDCAKYNATAAHYIGEMCRYVLATPPSPADKQHNLRIIYGNGMKPQVWTEFVKRFNIKHVTEFYASTEGNANIANTDGTPGAVGFLSRTFAKMYPIAIIKVDLKTGEPIRDSRGLCQRTRAGEPGVLVGKISPNNPSREYVGYVDKEATEKKIIRNVFTHGDSAFISGDILVSDELGYVYFCDRTGDTYRWRGENVSTTEVEAVISRAANQRDAVVYGVEIPNIEGRAGMCGIVDADGSLDLDKLTKDIAKDLPKYARPVFIRIMLTMDITDTFKMRKVDLQKEGCNPYAVNDKLYYFDKNLDKYVSLGTAEYEKILSGQIRL